MTQTLKNQHIENVMSFSLQTLLTMHEKIQWIIFQSWEGFNSLCSLLCFDAVD